MSKGMCAGGGYHPNPFEEVEYRLWLQQLREAQIIPESDWELLELHYLQGYTFQEIADQRGQPCSSIRSRVKRALEHLHYYVEKFDTLDATKQGVRTVI